ncbi:MAG: DUF3786 domain-containing protein [Desulfobacteraceae bacterium]|nr:DUF3786 domain-containing protein [Desulfobacteraceae bacterium]
MTELIDNTNFLDLKSCDPEDVTLRTGCKFDKSKNQYVIKIWGRSYCIDLNNYEIKPVGSHVKTYRDFLYLFILYYLMKSKNIDPSGTWVSEKDITGGAAFFRGPHTIPTDVIIQKFGDDIALFKKECNVLGGSAINLADVAFAFQITPSIPVAVLYWQGDEDFPSEAKLLFDKTIEHHLPLDIIYALAVEICHAL